VKLLAMDTSSLACSVAVQSDEAVIERHEEQPREHTRLLVPMIREALSEAGLSVEALDAIVLGNGPGSFIGMRIAASVAQGLAHGAGIGIVPVSSLAAVAAEVLASSDAGEVVVAQDAHMNEVYLGAFGRGARALPEALFAERLSGQVIIDELNEGGASSRMAAGAGWQRYPALLAANDTLIGNTSPVLYPRARCLLPLGVAALADGATIAPQDLVPAYLRARVAARPAADKP
jgi:tRNA threonylcarbamoyladenosine biosynthesis protein TsaB